ncbi:unnamed protein product [Calicophoron daubneyi]|uniref:Phosphatidylinositol-3,4,5-trisphosphate 3-phosphatase n=1 Tax=Calicophoron daubneyi TaxID=300641 RepID=A0AAV2TKA1_CALDB
MSSQRIQRLTQHIVFRLFICILICVDLVVEGFAMVTNSRLLDGTAMLLTFLFLVEDLFVLFGLGFRAFFLNWVNVLDLTLVTICFVLAVITFSILHVRTRSIILLIGLRLLRLPRLIHAFRLFKAGNSRLIRAARRTVSENKRRYSDGQFDLDLSYITDSIIGMSFPSTGLMSLYRNPMSEVEHFLDLKYGSSYKVINLCHERGYSSFWFHGRTQRYYIKDHSVPRLSELLDITKSASQWLDCTKGHAGDPKSNNRVEGGSCNKRCIVIHCKGGKGRTGTVISSLLLYRGVCSSAEQALRFFGERRTDLGVGSKFQGVETPSQRRYVHYFARLKNHLNWKIPNVRLKLETIIIEGIQPRHRDDVMKWYVEVTSTQSPVAVEFLPHHHPLNSVHTFTLLNSRWSPELQSVTYHLFTGDADDCVATCQRNCWLEGDVQVKLREPKNRTTSCCSMRAGRTILSFWFHTGFVTDHRLLLQDDEFDERSSGRSSEMFTDHMRISVQFSRE